jgi:hypothetical protein
MKLGAIKNFIKNYRHFFILIPLAVIFFIGSSSYNYYSQKEGFIKWSSPDETANYIFTKLYSEEKNLRIFEKQNLYASDIIHPRSFRSDFGYLKPVSFPGMILVYGKIAALTSSGAIPYLTPFFAALGVIFYYLLIKKIFGPANALISAFLLASFPVYIYYSARSMFHNVLFIVFFIIGLYFSILMAERNGKKEKLFFISLYPTNTQKYRELLERFLFYFKKSNKAKLFCAGLAGFFIGLAITVRPPELLWLGPALIIAWLFNINKISIAKILIFISFVFFAALPSFYWNQILFGSPYLGGYPQMNSSILNIKDASSALAKSAIIGKLTGQKDTLLFLKDNIFPFGYHIKDAAKTAYFYLLGMFPWLFYPAFFGFIILFQKLEKWRIKHYAFFLPYFLTSLFLIIYYGSWKFSDNPDFTSHTIGNSYTRYWLPIYLGAMPLASVFINKLFLVLCPQEITSQKWQSGLLIKLIDFLKKTAAVIFKFFIITFIFFISIKFVLSGSEEGLINTYKKQQSARGEYAEIMKLTDRNSIIITQYHDKLFFPERKVIYGLFDDPNMIKNYAILAKSGPIYYYNFTLPEKDFNYLNKSKLSQFRLSLLPVSKIKKDFTLYKLNYAK